jgi:hypothetical protein
MDCIVLSDALFSVSQVFYLTPFPVTLWNCQVGYEFAQSSMWSLLLEGLQEFGFVTISTGGIRFACAQEGSVFHVSLLK